MEIEEDLSKISNSWKVFFEANKHWKRIKEFRIKNNMHQSTWYRKLFWRTFSPLITKIAIKKHKLWMKKIKKPINPKFCLPSYNINLIIVTILILLLIFKYLHSLYQPMNDKKIKKYTKYLQNEIRKAWNVSRKEWKWIMSGSNAPLYEEWNLDAIKNMEDLLNHLRLTFSFLHLDRYPENNEEKENE